MLTNQSASLAVLDLLGRFAPGGENPRQPGPCSLEIHCLSKHLIGDLSIGSRGREPAI